MICLTGDLHHSSLRTGNQKACDISEIQVAQRYLKMLEEAHVKVTFFITGKAFAEEWKELKPICESPFVSVQGHTYYCFEPQLWHRFWKKVNGSYNGPEWYQRYDVKKTIAIIQQKTGKRITCWRNHMYMHGPFTDKILRECAINICSDEVDALSTGPYRANDGLYHFPINIIPDHEHLYHAERTIEWVEKWRERYQWKDSFGSQSYHIEEWTELVLEGLKQNEQHSVLSVMIIHPITLYLCDKFKSFEKILEFLSSRSTVHLTEFPLESVSGRQNDAL